MKTTNTHTKIVGEAECITLGEQINELVRERAERNKTWYRLVKKGEMTSAQAYTYAKRLDAAIRTLEWLQRNEAEIRDISLKKAGAR